MFGSIFQKQQFPKGITDCNTCFKSMRWINMLEALH